MGIRKWLGGGSIPPNIAQAFRRVGRRDKEFGYLCTHPASSLDPPDEPLVQCLAFISLQRVVDEGPYRVEHDQRDQRIDGTSDANSLFPCHRPKDGDRERHTPPRWPNEIRNCWNKVESVPWFHRSSNACSLDPTILSMKKVVLFAPVAIAMDEKNGNGICREYLIS